MSPFKIRRSIGPNHTSDTQDILQLRRTLQLIGVNKDNDSHKFDWIDDDLIRSLKQIQSAYGIQVDGVVEPGGPTEEILNRLLSASFRAGGHIELPEEVNVQPARRGTFQGPVPERGRGSHGRCQRNLDIDNAICGRIEESGLRGADQAMPRIGQRAVCGLPERPARSSSAYRRLGAVTGYAKEAQ